MTLSQTTRKHVIAIAITAGALVGLSAVVAEAQQPRTYANPNPVLRPGFPGTPARPALGFTPCNPGNTVALFGACVAKVGQTLHVQQVQASIGPVALQFLANTNYSTAYSVVTYLIPAGPSHFTTPMPRQLCGPNNSQPTYNVFLLASNGQRHGPIASFTPNCK